MTHRTFALVNDQRNSPCRSERKQEEDGAIIAILCTCKPVQVSAPFHETLIPRVTVVFEGGLMKIASDFQFECKRIRKDQAMRLTIVGKVTETADGQDFLLKELAPN